MLTIKQTTNFLKKNSKLIVVIVLFITLILIGCYSYFQHKLEKDVELGQMMNGYENVLGAIRNAEEMSLADEDRRKQIKDDLKLICEQNEGLKNTLRARYILAKLDYEDGDFTTAKKNFFSIFENNKKHHLAPIALLQAAILHEEEVDYQLAIDLLEQHGTYYKAHFTYGESLIALARNYELQGNYTKANEILQNILKNEDLAIYHSKAEERMDLLIVKGHLKRPAGIAIPPKTP